MVSIEIIITSLMTLLTGVAGWLVGKRKRDNDFLSEQQKSINLLVDNNNAIIARYTSVQNDNMTLRAENNELKEQVKSLLKENEQLRKRIETLSKKIESLTAKQL